MKLGSYGPNELLSKTQGREVILNAVLSIKIYVKQQFLHDGERDQFW